MTNILLVLTIRPATVEQPPCPIAAKYLDSNYVYIEDIGGIDNKYLTALACQLMDVVRIPLSLEKLLKKICHGVPYWCEQVLIDMVEKKQLMILETAEGSQILETTVAPNPDNIKKIQYTDEQPAAEYKQSSDVFLSALTVESIVDRDEPKSHSFLKDLGYVHKETAGKGTFTQRIAVFCPHINPEDIPVPDIMKNLITAKIDSMRATEQLIVKCAAILGEIFTRDMIENILPNVNRIKARKSFKVLRKIGIFECANLYDTHYSKFSKETEEISRMECYCRKDEEDINKDQCNLMKFTNLILKDTCYQILMESQRKSLHASAADYLEKKADELRKGIPNHILERPPPKRDLVEKDSNHSRRRNLTKVEDTSLTNAKIYVRTRGRRKGIQIQDVSVLIPTLLESLKSDKTVEQACECLLPIYSQIYHHRQATKDYMKIIDILVEEAAASIILKQITKAREKLEEAEEVINKMIEEEKKDENDENLNVLYAKLARLTGKALAVAGEEEESYLYIKHAAHLLGITEPEGYCHTRIQLLFYWLLLTMLRNSKRPRKPATEKTVEQGNCLAELYEFEKEIGDELLLTINILKQMVKVTGRNSNLHQIVHAYKVMIEFWGRYKYFGKKEKLEKEFLAMCSARNEELQSDDLIIMSEVCANICQTSLQTGDISRAISSGKNVVEIGDSMTHDIDKSVYPMLILILMFSNNREDCLDILEKMRSYNAKKHSNIGQTWYYAINMEIMLSWNKSEESFDNTIDFATKLMSKPDAVYNEMLPRYMLAMSIALWYCRHDQWSRAQIWFDYWEMFDLGEINFLSVYVLARKIEIMLMSLCVSKVTKPKFLWKKLQKSASQDLKKMAAAVRKVITLQPRYYHLQSYFLALKYNFFLSELQLNKALKLAYKQNNKMEYEWIKHHKQQWFRSKSSFVGPKPVVDWYQLFGSSHHHVSFC